MITKTYYLKDYYPKLKYNPYIEITMLDEIIGKDFSRCAIIVPGGGYDVVSKREGDPICLEFLRRGYKSVKLVYSVDPINHKINYPNQVLELMAAFDFLLEHKEELKISGDIVLCGFSAGGHLVGTYSYLYKNKALMEELGITRNLKPKAVVLAYPVVTMVGATHQDTKDVITGKNHNLDQLLSIELNVDSTYPKTFLWATKEDELVPISNTILLDEALTKHGVTHKTIIYGHGCHGLALANKLTTPLGRSEEKAVANWINEALDYLDEV